LILTSDDCKRLAPETLAALLTQLKSQAPTPVAPEALPEADEFDMVDVVDLTRDQVAQFVEGIHEQTVNGLRIFAEHGPVIDAHLLDQVGITNYAHFQGRVTKRTRTVTRN